MTIRLRDLLAACAVPLAFLPFAAAHAAVTISTSATSNMSCVSGVCTPTAANAVLNVGDLTTMLASGKVTVNTGTGSLAQQVEDIVVAAPFNWSSANALTLDAWRSVTINASMVVNGSAPVSLVTNDGGSGGNLSFPSGGSLSFLGTSNALTIDGNAFTLESSVKSLANAIAANASGNYALASTYDAGKDGTYSASPITTTFAGIFDGLGNAIENLAISQDQKKGGPAVIGLFAQEDGVLRNINLVSVDINAKAVRDVGALVAENGGTISQVSVTGTVRGIGSVGGIVGANSGVIANSWATASVTGTIYKYGNSVGGLVGVNSGTVDSSYATGSVRQSGASPDNSIGGLVGCSCGGTVSNSHATGDVSGALFGGGLAGYNTRATIINSYATGNVKASYAAGGLVGYNDASEVTADVEQTFATGDVSGGYLVGGLVGYNQYGEILNSYAEGRATATGSNSAAGGLVGESQSYSPYDALVATSYSTGLVKGADGAAVGGFMGGDGGTNTNDYWDKQTSKTKDGVANGNQQGITGETTAQLQSALPAGFDPGIWAESPSINNGLPYLVANPPQQARARRDQIIEPKLKRVHGSKPYVRAIR